MPVSANGYTANDIRLTQVWTIPDTKRQVRLRHGAPGELLTLWAAWFDKNIEDIEGGVLDDWGYAERPIRGSTTTLSNHASGTAIDLNATKHVLGKRGTFSDTKTKAIRAHLKEFDGCIRWGGDYQNRADEMHFEIDASPEKCAATLTKLTTPEDDMPTIAELLGAKVTMRDDQGKDVEVPLETVLRNLQNQHFAQADRLRTVDGKLDKVIEALGKEAGQ